MAKEKRHPDRKARQGKARISVSDAKKLAVTVENGKMENKKMKIYY